MKKYFSNLWVAIAAFGPQGSKLINALFLGDPDETLSSRCGKRLGSCKFCSFLCWVLRKLDPNHCRDAILPEEGSDSVI
jgi:hypothetical protein